MTYGLLLAGGGLLALSTISADTSYWVLFPIFAIMGHGMGATMAPMTAAVMNSVGHERAGLGSAMTNTSREVGGVFGIALLGTVLFTKLNSTLEASLGSIGLSSAQRSGIAAAASHGVLDPSKFGLSEAQIAAVKQAFGDAFMSGFRIALLVAGAVLVIAAVVANRFIPGREAVAARAPEAAVGEQVAVEF
jgi:DHA2 family integral membrane protein (MFS transporter)